MRHPSDSGTRARSLQKSADRRFWSALLSFRDGSTYALLLVIVILSYFAFTGVDTYRTAQRTKSERLLVRTGLNDLPELLEVYQMPTLTATSTILSKLPSKVEELPPISYDGFEILSDSRVVDMRGWVKVPLADRTKLKQSPIRWVRMIRLRRLTASATSARFQFLTTGLEIQIHAPGYSYEVEWSSDPENVGQRAAKRYDAVVDTSEIPLDTWFTIRIDTVYWNSFQGEPTEWAAMRIDTPMRAASLWILLPESRPASAYALVKYPTRRDRPVVPIHEESDGINRGFSVLHWPIPNPSVGYTYEIRWNWGSILRMPSNSSG